jgi:hypothetical protein
VSSDTDTPAGPFTLSLAAVNGATPEQAITRDLGPHASEEEVEFYARIAMRTAPQLGWERAREVAYLVRLGRAEERAAERAAERARSRSCGVVVEFPRRGGAADTA